MLKPGALLGKYRIVRPLGRGGTGVVYLAEDRSLGREIALKILDTAISSSEDFEWRFRQEARVIAALRHPRIIQIHSLDKISGALVIDMDYAEAGALSDAFVRGKVGAPRALRCTRDVLEALSSCHAQGIVHRDVKPSNILLAMDGGAILTDFGLAKLLAEHHSEVFQTCSSSGLFVGTPRYAPPESWDGVSATPAWDVYSVGVVLYESITAQPTYTALTPLALMKQMVERPIPPLLDVTKTVSAELNDLVLSMTNRDPNQRPANASEALARLHKTPEFAAEFPGQAPTVAMRLSWRARRRHRKMWQPRKPLRLRLRRTLPQIGIILAIILGLTALWVGHASQTDSPIPAASAPHAPPGVYDTVDAETQRIQRAHWLMREGQGPREWDVFASAESHLWKLHGRTEEDGALEFEGNWAEYADSTARVFRYGTVQGRGSWVADGAEMALSLDFRSTQDGALRSRGLFLRRSDPEVTPANFLQERRRADFLEALLYNELLPRGASWAEQVEALLLPDSGARVKMPFVQGIDAAAVLDGQLTESFWRTLSIEGAEAPAANNSEAAPSAKLFVGYGESGLHLGFRMPHLPSGVEIALHLTTSFDVHTNDSPRWFAQFGKDGITAHWNSKGGRRQSWECIWKTAIEEGTEWREAEVLLPYASVGLDKHPNAGSRWLLNAAVFEQERLDQKPLTYWGSKDIVSPGPGIVLVFGAS